MKGVGIGIYYIVPKEFIFVDDVPMTPAGKIQKAALKKQYFEVIDKDI